MAEKKIRFAFKLIIALICIWLAGMVLNFMDVMPKLELPGGKSKPEKKNVVIKKSLRSKYKINKNYIYEKDGKTWMFVLVDKDITKAEIGIIFSNLRNEHPNDFFQLFNDVKAMENYYLYVKGKRKWSKILENNHLGIIRSIEVWKFTSYPGYLKLKKK